MQTTTLTALRVRDIPIEFADVTYEQDCVRLQAMLLERVAEVRRQAEDQVTALASTVDELIDNTETAQLRAALDAAIRPLRTWLTNNGTLAGSAKRLDEELLKAMSGLRYVASLRGSVNRRGRWINFDYWHVLGFGGRTQTLVRSERQLIELRSSVQISLDDPELEPSHGFLGHFHREIATRVEAFLLDVQQLSATAFAEQLGNDDAYWQWCRNQWGLGPGYRQDIVTKTREWFAAPERAEKHAFVETEIQRRWQETIQILATQLETAEIATPM
jgi:hypothetical protein